MVQTSPEGKAAQEVMENFQTNQAQIIFHQLCYFQNLITNPQADDDNNAYGAEEAWNLTRKYQTEHAMKNADSYALDAMAIFLQRSYKLNIPPVPFS